ncbi:TonB-dependent receptor [Flavivirga amylovorans]
MALSPGNSFSQEKVKINADKQISVDEVFKLIKTQTKYTFIYPESLFEDAPKVELKKGVLSVGKLLQKTLPKGKFNVILGADNRITIKQKSQSQQRQITGKVTGEDGMPLAGVTVLVKGTTRGVATNFDGQYTVTVIDNSNVIIFSYVGYTIQEITVGKQTKIDIVMKEEVSELDEVVVSTGYWKESKKVSTSSIGKIEAKTIEQQPIVNPIMALQGQIAGVQINQTSGVPGTAIDINIRGLNSLNNGQDDRPNANLPFYVIDGVPFPSSSPSSLQGIFSNSNPLANIRPDDIESIEVLKDADATAIYGSRGANGVILITTKKGKPGKMKIDLDVSRGFGTTNSRVDLLNTAQYLELRREAFANDGLTPTETNAPDLMLWDQNRYTDWQKELLGGTAEQANTSVSFSGGTEQTQYLIRGNFIRQTNVFNYDDSEFKSGSGHFNLNHTSKDSRFNINLSATYTITDNIQNSFDLVGDALRLAPNAPRLFDDNGNINFADSFDNPLSNLERTNILQSNNLVSNLNLNYEFTRGLSFKALLGFNNITSDQSSINPLSSRSISNQGTGASSLKENSGVESYIIEPQLEFTHKLGKGGINVLLGATFQESTSETLSIGGFGYDSDALLGNLQAAPNTSIFNDAYSEYRYNAIYARLNYNWQRKYILNLTGRRDGSSRFGPNKRFGNFGAIGVAWVFSEETFIRDKNSFISFGKLRASYGLTGNDQIGDYGFLSSYSVGDEDGYNGSTALIITRAANPSFSWETNKKLEVGLELGLLKNSINAEISMFRNRSSNQLIGRPLSAVTGFNTVQFNLPALVENRGVEITLNTTNITTDDFNWSTSINFTSYRNELVEFPNIEDFSAFDNRYVVGESIFGSKQFKTLGVNPETGIFDFVDYNNDGLITASDSQDFVDQAQDFFGGISNSIRFKGFQLDFLFRFAKQEATDFKFITSSGGFNLSPISIYSQDRWQNPGDTAIIGRATTLSNTNGSGTVSGSNSSRVDASFIRLQNVSLAWYFPEAILNNLKLEQARLYFQGQNLWTITKFDGLDPETGNRSLPPLEFLTFGLQLTF